MAPKVDVSKFVQQTENAIAAQFSKGLSSGVKSAALGALVTVGETAAQQFIKSMSQGASKALTSRLAGQDTAIGKLGETLIDSLVDQLTKAANNRIKSGGNLARGAITDLTGAAPAGYKDPFAGVKGQVTQRRFSAHAVPGGAVAGGPDFSFLLRAPGEAIPTMPAQQTFQQRMLGYSGSLGRGLLGGGRAFAQGPLATGAAFYMGEHSVGSVAGSASSAMQSTVQLTQTLAALQKNIGDATASSQSYLQRMGGSGADLGLLPMDAASAASIYLPAARRGGAGAVSHMMHFASGYGMAPDAWAAQMSQAAGLGYVGGAKNSAGMGQYQATLAQSYAGTSGIAKMPEYTTGWQDFARIIQANTVTNQNPTNASQNGALQLYTALNKTGIAGLSGTSGAALLGQLNQGIVNAPNASTGVQMAYYQALGGKKGISPSQLAYQTEEGLSGNNFKKVLDYSNKAYAGFSWSDKRYAQSKLFGLNMHQTDAVIKAYGSGNNGFSMQSLYGLVGGQKNMYKVNDSQFNLLTQLATGKSTSTVASEMKQQNISGVDQFYKGKHFLGANKQQLANVVMGVGTPQSSDVSATGAMNAFQRELQNLTQGIAQQYLFIKQAADGFAPIIGTLTTLGLIKLGKVAIKYFLPAAETAGGDAATTAATGGAAGLAARLGGKFGPTLARFGPSAAALALATGATWAQHQQAATMAAQHGKGFHSEDYLGQALVMPNGTKANFGDFLFGHQNPGSILGLDTSGYNTSPVHGLLSLLGVGIHGGKATGAQGGPGHIPGMTPTGPAGGGGFGTILGKHVQSMGNIYTDHLKAANKVTEDEAKRSLSTVTPLPTNTLRQFNSDLSTFVKNFGDKLDGWLQAALNQATSSSTLPGGSSGAFGSAGSAITSLGGSNPFSKYGIAAKYGKDQGGLFGSYHDVEKGNVYKMPVGSAVDLPTAAKYMAHDSTKYQSVFQLPNGQAMNFMHINATHFKNGQMVKAGQSIGTVGDMSGAYSAKTWDGKMSHSYFQSNPGLMEFGVFDNATDAFMRDSQTGNPYNMNGSVDPNAFLASLGQGGPTGGGGTMGVPPGLSPQLKKLYQAAGAKYHVPWQFLAKQGFKESSWNPKASQRGGYGRGIAQFDFTPGANAANSNFYLGGGGVAAAMDPKTAIMGQASYMHDLMYGGNGHAGEGGNLWAAARDYNGIGDKAVAYANSLVGPQGGVGGGGSGVLSPSGGTFEATLHLIYPNGATQDVQATFRPKYAGVIGVHIDKKAPHKKAPVR